MTNKARVLAISKKLGLSHIGSCLSALPVYEEIYAKKKPDDIVIACNAHSHLAHLVVRAQYETDNHFGETNSRELDVEYWIRKDIHCNRKAGCDASGGSLGHGLGIGIGYALADRNRDVYVMVSEGSMAEGSSWEALHTISDLNLTNMKIYTNFNGYSAVVEVDKQDLAERMNAFCHGINIRFTDNGLPELDGVQGHYKVLEG